MKAKNKSFKLLMVLSLLMCLVGINLFKPSNVFAADYGNKFITGHELTDDLGNPKTDFGIYDVMMMFRLIGILIFQWEAFLRGIQ
ncbi:hypothetical protein [Lactococcus lactis]|uniref:hypothetical protein n=1 Tax=Lactococcus lactis TaxID=1358 RepID=UPI0022E4F779|nr:hypothetical protein [Lactococcus lactis]